jgi:hypothetical protein
MSTPRRCDIWKATNDKWYMTLGDFEYAYEDDDCTTYGPFKDCGAVEDELDNHSNPGGSWVDESGTKAPPVSPRKPNQKYRYG